jgi:hypothetical protein
MKNTIIAAGLVYAAAMSPAYAYIDPITGSFIFQALIGGVAAAMVAIKRVRVKILSLFGIKKQDDDTDPETTPDPDTTRDPKTPDKD